MTRKDVLEEKLKEIILKHWEFRKELARGEEVNEGEKEEKTAVAIPKVPSEFDPVKFDLEEERLYMVYEYYIEIRDYVGALLRKIDEIYAGLERGDFYTQCAHALFKEPVWKEILKAVKIVAEGLVFDKETTEKAKAILKHWETLPQHVVRPIIEAKKKELWDAGW